ncbi:MAG: hypothetical protein JSS30_07040 [Verrucomicrobia bacterium]|nr:hypothetical protein [Verrucomicrobiota bacterium]
MFTDFNIVKGDNLKQYALARVMGQHWIEEVPADNKPGATWQKIDHEGQPRHLHLLSGDLYRADSASWSAVKTLGMIWIGGYYYFGAALLRHFGSGVVKGAKAAHEVVRNGLAMRDQVQFNWKTHLLGSGQSFKAALADFTQAGKDLLFLAPFYFETFYISSIFKYAASFYTFYNPHEPRVMIEAVQSWWRPNGVQPLEERVINGLSVWDTVDHLTNGSYTLTQLFRSNAIGKNPVLPVIAKPIAKGEETEDDKKKSE